MALSFSAAYPTWLRQPSIVINVLQNSFAPLKDVPDSLNLTDSSLFMTGLRQALFWRRRLTFAASSCTVIFSFLGVGGLTSPNILEVCRALRNVPNISQPVEVYKALNSPFIGISFIDSSSATLFQSLCHSFNDSLVLQVAPSSTYSHHFKLLGLPPLFPDARIHHFISKHSVKHFFTRELIPTDDNTSIPLNSVTGTLQLAPSQDINHLPHLIPLPAPHLGSALLVINGRQSFCLKCGGLGHIRRHCTSPRCTTCHRFHPALSSCSSTNMVTDSSGINHWELEDYSDNTPSTASPPVSHPVPECIHTCESSSPPSSSTLIPSSYADVAALNVHSIVSSDPPIAEAFLQSSSHAIPHLLPHLSPLSHPDHSTTSKSAVSSASPLAIPTVVYSGAPFSLKASTSRTSKAVSSQSTSTIAYPAASSHEALYKAARQAKKSSRSSKRFHASSSTSSSASSMHSFIQ